MTDVAAFLAATEAELRKRYGIDYDVVPSGRPAAALTYLAGAHTIRAGGALILADLWMPQTTGAAFLARAHDSYPTARRALLAHWGDPLAREAIRQAFVVGQAELHLMKPTQRPSTTSPPRCWPSGHGRTPFAGPGCGSSATERRPVAMRRGTCRSATACRSSSW